MNITTLDKMFSISPQIRHKDIHLAASKGFTTIINNRPDLEQPDQPLSDDLQQESLKAGLKYHHIPIVPGRATPLDLENFRKALSESEGPVLAFCKSGMRAKSMYTASLR